MNKFYVDRRFGRNLRRERSFSEIIVAFQDFLSVLPRFEIWIKYLYSINLAFTYLDSCQFPRVTVSVCSCSRSSPLLPRRVPAAAPWDGIDELGEAGSFCNNLCLWFCSQEVKCCIDCFLVLSLRSWSWLSLLLSRQDCKRALKLLLDPILEYDAMFTRCSRRSSARSSKLLPSFLNDWGNLQRIRRTTPTPRHNNSEMGFRNCCGERKKEGKKFKWRSEEVKKNRENCSDLRSKINHTICMRGVQLLSVWYGSLSKYYFYVLRHLIFIWMTDL